MSGVAVLNAVARAVTLVTVGVAVIIALGIALRALGAQADHPIVSVLVTAAAWLVGPFESMFLLRSTRAELLVNWGSALLVYTVAGTVLARAIREPEEP